MKKLGAKEKKRKKKPKVQWVSVPFLEPELIEDESYRRVRFRDDKVSLDEVCARLDAEVGLKVIYSTEASAALGSLDFNAFAVTIFTSGRSLDSQRFALAYLIGHVVLDHGKYMESGVCYETHVDIRLFAFKGVEKI